jgi:hypothetical protein
MAALFFRLALAHFIGIQNFTTIANVHETHSFSQGTLLFRSVIIPFAGKRRHQNQPYIINAINSLKSQITSRDQLIVVSGRDFNGHAQSITSNLVPVRVIHVYIPKNSIFHGE